MPLKMVLELNSFSCYVLQLENEYTELGKVILFAFTKSANVI